ncbi:MAG: tRNA (adenosine(37)-N6)-dimethylallyltransferase MiaA [Dehalococcoidales bacterium]|nr:tRNA (adenosine(37)-N6)-dimethylallyltransferase MiaA [Dehalococcoidales bacterium]
MNKLVAIIGPTGIGKTKLAIQLARLCNGEIVNADSRQIYCSMDIGTAKPTQDEMVSVPHHLIDIIAPNQEFSLAEYQSLAYKAIVDIQKRGKLPFLVGGSGLYVWAVIEGWIVPKVAPDTAFRREQEKKAEEGKAGELYQELIRLDPVAAGKIDPRNVRRVIRALEVSKNAPVPFSGLQQKQPPSFQISILGLTADRKELYRRADARVDKMVQQGFIEEVKKLLAMGYNLNLPAMSSIGYREIGQYLLGEMTLDEALYKIKVGTHRFIRHQYAWFRLKDERIKWFDAEKMSEEEVEKVVKGFIRN